jgi:hypothetical protein
MDGVESEHIAASGHGDLFALCDYRKLFFFTKARTTL